MSDAVLVTLRGTGREPLCATVTETAADAGRLVRVLLSGAEGIVVLDEHLRAAGDAPARTRGIADVLVGAESADESGGAAVVASPRGDRCLLRCGAGRGPRPVVRVWLGSACRARAPWETWASVAHAWLVAGLPVEKLAAAPPPWRRIRRPGENSAGSGHSGPAGSVGAADSSRRSLSRAASASRERPTAS